MGSKNTILFFNTNRAWGGGEKWHFEMAQSLQNRHYPVHVFAAANSALLEKCLQAGLPVSAVRCGKQSYLNPLKVREITKKIAALQAETVILNLPADMKCGGLAAKKAGVRNILYRRGTALPVKPHLINKFFFRNILSGVIANSKETKSLINKRKELIKDDKIHVIYNGISKIPDIRKKKSNNTFVIGNAGRLVKQKGQDYLIELAKLLLKHTSDFEIRIAGDGPLRAELEESIRKHELQNHIRMEGFQEDLSAFYNSLDVFVLPSRWEGFGYVMAEAMMHQLPVIAFRVSSNPEIVEHGKSGFLISFEDMNAMTEKIMCLKKDRILAWEMGDFAREHAIKCFSHQRSVDELEKVINRD